METFTDLSDTKTMVVYECLEELRILAGQCFLCHRMIHFYKLMNLIPAIEIILFQPLNYIRFCISSDSTSHLCLSDKTERSGDIFYRVDE